MKRRSEKERSGFSILELVIAMTIFFVSYAAITHLWQLGLRAMVSNELRTEALVRCRSKLTEAIAIRNGKNESGTFDDFRSCSWHVTWTEGPFPSTQTVLVRVAYEGEPNLGIDQQLSQTIFQVEAQDAL